MQLLIAKQASPAVPRRPRNSVTYHIAKYFGIWKMPVVHRRHIHAQKTTKCFARLHVSMLIFSSLDTVGRAAYPLSWHNKQHNTDWSTVTIPPTWEGFVLNCPAATKAVQHRNDKRHFWELIRTSIPMRFGFFVYCVSPPPFSSPFLWLGWCLEERNVDETG